LFKITDQPVVVNSSVNYFLVELLIAIIAVVVVIMILLPLKVALIAAATIPVSIFISLGLFYAFDIELNTVTLACLIVSLGMIVDNSVVIIDDYVELISEGIPGNFGDFFPVSAYCDRHVPRFPYRFPMGHDHHPVRIITHCRVAGSFPATETHQRTYI